MAKENIEEKAGKSDNKQVAIHIDKKQVKSPGSTTGAALYTLGGVNPDEYDLFRETHSHGDDEQISNNAIPVELKNGDHLFSIKKKLNPGGAGWL